jgi:hypothetical protein
MTPNIRTYTVPSADGVHTLAGVVFVLWLLASHWECLP